MTVLVLAATWKDHLGHELYPGLKERILKRYDAHADQREEQRRVSGMFAATRPKRPSLRVPKPSAGSCSKVEATRLRAQFERQVDQVECVVAEISVGGLDLGMRLEVALEKKKRILCLFRTAVLVLNHDFSPMLIGNELVTLKPYMDLNDHGLDSILDEFFRQDMAHAAAR